MTPGRARVRRDAGLPPACAGRGPVAARLSAAVVTRVSRAVILPRRRMRSTFCARSLPGRDTARRRPPADPAANPAAFADVRVMIFRPRGAPRATATWVTSVELPCGRGHLCCDCPVMRCVFHRPQCGQRSPVCLVLPLLLTVAADFVCLCRHVCVIDLP